jgi:hypothetical protein
MTQYGQLFSAAASKTPRQLAGILYRKARNRLYPRLPVDFDGWYRRRIPDGANSNFAVHGSDTTILRDALANAERERYRSLATDFGDGDVTFLNRTRTVVNPPSLTPDDDRIENLPRLWYLKLAGLEPVRWTVTGFTSPDECPAVVSTLDSWLRSLPKQEPIASRTDYLRGFWTPYAVSLRVVALCRYAAWRGELPEGLVPFLYKNLLFLASNVETDVGGNHLFENGAALVAGGLAVSPDGRQFVDTGLDVLASASAEQFLDDGYHYERSPMYHLAVTARLLTVLSLLSASDRPVPNWLRTRTARACAFLPYLRPPDGRIPLLNDAVLGEADRLETVSRYARAVGVDPDPLDAPGESELHWLAAGDLRLLFDAGDSGPPSHLGHTHNDPCTVLVWSGSNRLVTDTGTFDYQPGVRRQTARSVRSHNTTHVDGVEPTSIGGRFRMGSAVTTTTTRHGIGDVDAVTAEYYVDDPEQYAHTRTCYAGPDWLFVRDDVLTDSEYVSRLHANPSVAIDVGDVVQFNHTDGMSLAVYPFNVAETTVRTASYFPRFGEERDRKVLELYSRTKTSGYALTLADTTVSLRQSNGQPTALVVEGEVYELPEARS